MPMNSVELLRSTVAALLHATGESQTELATALGMTQGAVSRKQGGEVAWKLSPDTDMLSAHFGIPVPDLLCGPTHALEKLPRNRRASVIGGTQKLFAV